MLLHSNDLDLVGIMQGIPFPDSPRENFELLRHFRIFEEVELSDGR